MSSMHIDRNAWIAIWLTVSLSVNAFFGFDAHSRLHCELREIASRSSGTAKAG